MDTPERQPHQFSPRRQSRCQDHDANRVIEDNSQGSARHPQAGKWSETIDQHRRDRGQNKCSNTDDSSRVGDVSGTAQQAGESIQYPQQDDAAEHDVRIRQGRTQRRPGSAH